MVDGIFLRGRAAAVQTASHRSGIRLRPSTRRDEPGSDFRSTSPRCGGVWPWARHIRRCSWRLRCCGSTAVMSLR